MSVVDLTRVRAAFAALDALLAAHPELRRGAARLAELANVAAEAEVDLGELANVAANVAAEAEVDLA